MARRHVREELPQGTMDFDRHRLRLLSHVFNHDDRMRKRSQDERFGSSFDYLDSVLQDSPALLKRLHAHRRVSLHVPDLRFDCIQFPMLLFFSELLVSLFDDIVLAGWTVHR